MHRAQDEHDTTQLTTTMIQIRYNHRSTQTADSYAAALDKVRAEMLPFVGAPVEIKCDDGTYIYRDQEAADRDDTGARAFAVICQPE